MNLSPFFNFDNNITPKIPSNWQNKLLRRRPLLNRRRSEKIGQSSTTIRVTLPRAYFTFVSSVADETKVKKNQVGANSFLVYWVVSRRPNKPKPESARLYISLILFAFLLNFQA